jgi:hypothetical protein
MSNADEKKLAGQRASVSEHIAKFENYRELHDKEFALKTISKNQGHIGDILRDHRHWPYSREDDWSPPSNWRDQFKRR